MGVSDRVVRAYLKTALWSSTDENGEALDAVYHVDDFAQSAVDQAASDLDDFFESNEEAIEASGLSDSDVAHNFWLTRNRHGAGFWDKGLGEIGEELTEAAHAYGESDAYEGDDGQIYLT